MGILTESNEALKSVNGEGIVFAFGFIFHVMRLQVYVWFSLSRFSDWGGQCQATGFKMFWRPLLPCWLYVGLLHPEDTLLQELDWIFLCPLCASCRDRTSCGIQVTPHVSQGSAQTENIAVAEQDTRAVQAVHAIQGLWICVSVVQIVSNDRLIERNGVD